jgi:hypothetical protein
MPTLSMSSCTTRAITVAPIPPPSLTRPLAVPRRSSNHWIGKLLEVVYIRLPPKPYKAPDTNRPSILLTVKLLRRVLAPNIVIPIRVLHRAPITAASQTQASPRATVRDKPSDPTKDSVLTGTFCIVLWRRAAWRMPQEPVHAFTQKVWTKHAKTMTQP